MEWPRDFQQVVWPNGGEVKSVGGIDYLVPFSLENVIDVARLVESAEEKKILKQFVDIKELQK